MPFIGKQSTSNSQITNYTTTVGSGGQTNFTVVIEGGDETHVYLNGVLLKETTDYTVSSTQVSLVSPAVENDIVEIKVFRSFALADAVRASTGGTFSGDVSFGDNNITNVGDIAVDTISSDAGTSIGVTLGTDAGDDFNVGSGKLVVEGDTGDVGLGTAEPEELLHLNGTEPVIKLTDSATSGAGFIDFDGSGLQLNTNRNPNTGTSTNTSKTNASIQLFGLAGDANIRFYTTTTNNSASTERMRILSGGDVEVKTGNVVFGTAGKGIDFSGHAHDSYMDSELLDHYERGVLDRPVSFGGNLQASGDFSYNTSSYVKIGELVVVNINFDTQNYSHPSGAVTFHLPYTALNSVIQPIFSYENTTWGDKLVEVPKDQSTLTVYTSSFGTHHTGTDARNIFCLFISFRTS